MDRRDCIRSSPCPNDFASNQNVAAVDVELTDDNLQEIETAAAQITA